MLIRYCFLSLFLFNIIQVKGQDAFPQHAEQQVESEYILPMRRLNLGFEKGTFEAVLPSCFEGVNVSQLNGKIDTLDSFFEKLRRVHTGLVTDSVRVLHIGDSHIRGHFFTDCLGEKLSEVFPAIKYDDFGINGATTRTFSKRNRLSKLPSYSPDLLVISFGTNESHDRGYNSIIHYNNLTEFLSEVRKYLPYTPILFTTPPGSFDRRGWRVYRVNPRTSVAAKTICNFADENELPYWDMFSVVGGDLASTNWKKAGLMRPDHVHYLPEGYQLQADLFYEALIRAYNEYITH